MVCSKTFRRGYRIVERFWKRRRVRKGCWERLWWKELVLWGVTRFLWLTLSRPRWRYRRGRCFARVGGDASVRCIWQHRRHWTVCCSESPIFYVKGGYAVDEDVRQGSHRQNVNRRKLCLVAVARRSFPHSHELILISSAVWLSRMIRCVMAHVKALVSCLMSD